MDFETFKEKIAEDVKAECAERGIGNVEITTAEVEKLNVSYSGMSVRREGENIGLTLNLDHMYEAMQNGETYDAVKDKAMNSVEENIDSMEVDVRNVTEYDQMKEKLSVEVVSLDANKDLLERVPHKSMEDLAIVYRLVLDTDDSSKGTILVTNSLMNNYGITPEQLHEDAMKNSPIIRPANIRGMSEVMMELMPRSEAEMLGLVKVDPADEQIFVATVPDKIHGAGVIAYPNFLEEAAEKVGGSYFVLPSSLHEVLLVPEKTGMQTAELEAMVRDVNSTKVAPEDKLSDNVYHYDANEHIFELAENYEDRINGIEDRAENSVLQDLKNTKDEISHQDAKEPIDKAVKKNRSEESL